MNLFTVVRFHNNPCTGSDASSSNGTCYSSEECSIRGGSSVGSCAGGYGVCCTCKYTIYIISGTSLLKLRNVIVLWSLDFDETLHVAWV